jgi:hypothetical protein
LTEAYADQAKNAPATQPTALIYCGNIPKQNKKYLTC